MLDPREENHRLWDEWSQDFQGLWEADTDEDELPPAPSPFTDDAPGGRHPELLPTVEGVDFVELGCGGGQASVGTAAAGADTAVGVDFSGQQLQYARQLRDLYGVEAQFVAGDVTRLPLAADRFDVAFSGWVFQMVEDLHAALREAHRVLREDGVLVFGVPHPFYEQFDPETEAIEFSYHEDPRREITISEDYEANMVVFDRKVGELHRALVDAGFEVERLLEPGSPNPEDYEDGPLASTKPELMARVPRNLRFWAVAR